MDWGLIKSHLQRAQNESRNSFEEYDALWSAFNVMYEETRSELITSTRNRRPSERDMIRHCVKKLNYTEWRQLLEPRKLDDLLSINPIFNERDWLREARMNTTEFARLVQTTKRALTGRVNEDVPPFEALVDLLYVVRCNRHMGSKLLTVHATARY